MITPTPEMLHAVQEEHLAHDTHPDLVTPRRLGPSWIRALVWTIAIAVTVVIVVRFAVRFGRP